MKVLLVGCGPIAVSYAQVLAALDVGFEVVGRGQSSAEAFFAKTGVKPYLGGLKSYLAERGLNQATAAIVALPVPALARGVDCLAAAGIARILVEKPAGLTEQEISDLALRLSHLPTQVFVAFNRRFYQSSIVARSLIAEDGGVTSFHVEFTERADRIASTAKDPALLQNWFLANSCHVLDLAFELGGRPTQLSGHVHGSLPGTRLARYLLAAAGPIHPRCSPGMRTGLRRAGGVSISVLHAAVSFCNRLKRYRSSPGETWFSPTFRSTTQWIAISNRAFTGR